MNTLAFAITIATAVTVLCEGILWRIFRQKMRPLSFPHELDTSYFRFFSIQRLQIIALLHALFVVACMVTFCIYLW